MKTAGAIRDSTPYSRGCRVVDRFKKEGKCFICHKKGHVAIDSPYMKNKKNDIMRKPRPGK
jgi:hypothetical protein